MPSSSSPGSASPGSAPLALLGGLSAERFLVEHWQKRPLLVRRALPGFRGLLTPHELAQLARKDGVAARTVVDHAEHSGESGGRGRDRSRRRRGRRWELDEEPRQIDIARAPPRNFTLLLQGIETHVDGGWELLRQFAFIPWARIDDLMVSYAAPGGSVGPHIDEYDVFLLQGPGRRRWQIDARTAALPRDARELRVVDDEDVPVLRTFQPSDEWTLECGDMLYLPPRVAHWGVAVDACMTYSIGFLAPTHEQLAQNFLAFLAQEPAASPAGYYSDADASGVQAHPAELADDVIARVERAALDALRWDRARVALFLGRYLTGPKPGVRFTAPSKRAPAPSLTRGTLALARQSRALFRVPSVDGAAHLTFFINGEAHPVSSSSAPSFRTLADERALALPAELDGDARSLVLDLIARGWLVVR